MNKIHKGMSMSVSARFATYYVPQRLSYFTSILKCDYRTSLSYFRMSVRHPISVPRTFKDSFKLLWSIEWYWFQKLSHNLSIKVISYWWLVMKYVLPSEPLMVNNGIYYPASTNDINITYDLTSTDVSLSSFLTSTSCIQLPQFLKFILCDSNDVSPVVCILSLLQLKVHPNVLQQVLKIWHSQSL